MNLLSIPQVTSSYNCVTEAEFVFLSPPSLRGKKSSTAISPFTSVLVPNRTSQLGGQRNGLVGSNPLGFHTSSGYGN